MKTGLLALAVIFIGLTFPLLMAFLHSDSHTFWLIIEGCNIFVVAQTFAR